MTKSGVPTPVTGSQPSVALNPDVPQPGLFPSVTSLKASGCAYTVGLMKPTALLPAASRASLTRVRMLPKVGEEAEVP